MFSFYEFFAGGGMARAGLGRDFECLFANDFDPLKEAAYVANWGNDCFVPGDVAHVSSVQLRGIADLAWASFPCQDLSLAGDGRGLGQKESNNRTRSGSFWLFWRLISSLNACGRAPKLIVLENVYGVLRSHKGRDFSAICAALASEGYRFGALVIDAKHFVPQSRPRVFILATHLTQGVPPRLTGTPNPVWHPAAVIQAFSMLKPDLASRWIWWKLPRPSVKVAALIDIVETEPRSVSWHDPSYTESLLSLMSDANLAKVEAAKRAQRVSVGTIYRRMRPGQDSRKIQRAEVRFDGVAGCLRTPAGGSSRQTLIFVDGQDVRTRLLSLREAARLMGLPDGYELPPDTTMPTIF